MSVSPVVVRGNIRPDGTLQLSNIPHLPEGPVEVIIRSLPQQTSNAEDWWQYLQRARAELEATGRSFMTGEEVNAQIDDLRSGDERLDEIYRQLEVERNRKDA